MSAAAFVPVLTAAQPALASGPGCATLRVTTADGATAAATAASAGADAWIADDASWAGTAPRGFLRDGAEPAVLATSPVYLVAGRAAAQEVQRAGGTWLGLAGLVTGPSPRLRLVVADPQASAVGLLGVGGLGEAVWQKSGMDASAAALVEAFARTRTVTTGADLLPVRPGEVALVPEQVLLDHAELAPDDVVLAPGDRTAMLRYSLLTPARAAADPQTAEAVRRLQSELTGTSGAQRPEVDAALAAAHLRRPDGAAPRPLASGAPSSAGPDVAGRLPGVLAPPFDVLRPHHVDHVFAVWYPHARRSNALLVIDVSGSMGRRLPGGGSTLITAARRGSSRVAAALPDDSILGLWTFGTRLDGNRDYRQVLPAAPLTAAHRAALADRLRDVYAQRTGTGLYDTVLAAYRAVAAQARPGVPNHVLVFTDGRNEADANSISAARLGAELLAASRTAPPVSVVVLSYGVPGGDDELAKALEPIGGEVQAVRTEQEVEAAFLHFAAGGLHPEE